MPWGGGDGVLANFHPDCALGRGVVIVTGQAPSTVLSQRTGIPVSRCLRKPFHLDALLNLVGRAALQGIG